MTLYSFAIENIVSFFLTNIIPFVGMLSFKTLDLLNIVAFFSRAKSPLTFSINSEVLQLVRKNKSKINLNKIKKPLKI